MRLPSTHGKATVTFLWTLACALAFSLIGSGVAVANAAPSPRPRWQWLASGEGTTVPAAGSLLCF